MRPMSFQTHYTDVLEAAEHLPVGATLVIHGFDWVDYERLLGGIGDQSHLRVSYDNGRLEILSPSMRHEAYAKLVDFFVLAFCEVRGLKARFLGQRRGGRSLSKGVWSLMPAITSRASTLFSGKKRSIWIPILHRTLQLRSIQRTVRLESFSFTQLSRFPRSGDTTGRNSISIT
jgi:hypothetical protein